MNIKNLSFTGQKYNFLQNQSDLLCAYCGNRIVSEQEFKKLYRSIEGKKGIELAKILEPYRNLYPSKKVNVIDEFIKYAKDEKFRNEGFKSIALHLKEGNIYNVDSKITLKNLLFPVLYSVEHTNPRSNGGKNLAANYLPMHVSCNCDRSSFSYGEMLAKNPDFAENIKKALQQLNNRRLSDKAGETHYNINLPDDYIEKIQDAIASQGIKKELILI